MRIGILSFGGQTVEPVIAANLRATDVDVITAEGNAADEARRLHRADCDGVVLLVESGASASAVGEAALHLSVPLLLVGTFGAALFDAAGALVEIGLHFDRLMLHDPAEATGAIAEWARIHRKLERQRGQEAAHKLYGQRFAVPAGVAQGLDPVTWRRQFGVTVVPAGESADFAATDDDVNGALTAHLLRLVSGLEEVYTMEVKTVPGIDLSSGQGATFARISRRAGRYVCVLLRGTLEGNGQVNLDCAPERLLTGLNAGRLYGVTGEHFGAVRAACEALDIEPLPLR